MFTAIAQSVKIHQEEEGTVSKMSCQRFDFNITGAVEKIPFDMTEPEKNIHLAFYFDPHLFYCQGHRAEQNTARLHLPKNILSSKTVSEKEEPKKHLFFKKKKFCCCCFFNK